MKKLLWLMLLLFNFCYIVPSAVTYKKNKGRFGDNLISFSQALWVSYKYNIPLLYDNFTHAKLLHLSRLHEHKTQVNGRIPLIIKDIQGYLDTKDQGNYLYIIPWKPSIHVDWNDKGFAELLRKEIAMIYPVPPLKLPSDRLAVAVHVRAGSGPDQTVQTRRAADLVHPNKFPPNSFFVEQIKRLSELLKDQPMYVHIFTDYPDPEKFVALFKEQVNKPNIEYGFKKNDTRKSSGVLEDFFHMVQFEYFIRPQSSFSFMADKLSNWKIVISPKTSVWKDNQLSVVEVETAIRNI